MEANIGGKESVLNVRSLRLHHDQLCVLVDSFKKTITYSFMPDMAN